MLYTKKGDDGTTNTFACSQRDSKSSARYEALGNLDELNSFLGLCKIKSKESGFLVGDISFSQIVHNAQQNLFVIQAEIGGAGKTVAEEKIKEMEKIIDAVEKILPPIKTFFISGATELSALFDVARTIARRAERCVVKVSEEKTDGKMVVVGSHTLAYLNRLSSLLYAMARLESHLSGVGEESPNYK